MSSDLNRLAYIIGNKDYQDMSVLGGSINDANLMESTLEECGFITNKFVNLKYSDFADKVYEFKYQCMRYQVGLFYYAGHGFESNGKNFLCPIDADLDSLEETNVNISNLVNEISKDRDFIGIIILDCCRIAYINNARGAAPINPIIPNFKNTGGTYVAYATTSGDAAFEERGNGLYTKLLCKHISQGNKQIEQVFKDVRKEIIEVKSSNNKIQVPWEYSSLVSEFYFIDKQPNNCIITLAEDAVNERYQFAHIEKKVKEYCEHYNLKEDKKNEVFLDILNEIDKMSKENTYA